MSARYVSISMILGLGIILALLSSACRSPQTQSDRSANEASPQDKNHGGMMRDRMMGSMPDWMMSEGMMDSHMMRDMQAIHDLLTQKEKVQRAVEDIPGGVRTVTTSTDPEVANQIRTHVRQMKERVEQGRPIRMMDPLFREIFRHHEEIKMEVVEVPGGVRVTETSDNPQVTLLIRQHARRAVSEFVTGGMQRAMQPTPLPEGYQSQE